jgi:molybdopterin molybdotransferase
MAAGQSVMIPISKAMAIIDRHVSALRPETASLDDAVDRVLAEDIIADNDLPAFDRSQMDGYAVKAKDVFEAPVELKVVGESAAGRGWRGTLKKGEAVRIMTGAPVPEGADAVQKVEETSEADGVVTITKPSERGRYIIMRGKEIKAGGKVLRAGTVITSNMVPTLAAFGYAKVRVARQPKVAVLATGSELVEINRKPKQDQIRNSNSSMLRALLADIGIDATELPIAKDDLASLKKQINDAAKKADVVIITGGVSVGKYDLTKPAFEEIGAKILFDKIELKPGKPTVFAKRKDTLFFGLPGNPVSVAVTFFLFVRKAILLAQNAANTDLPTGFAVLESAARGVNPRDSYLPATLATSSDGRLTALPLQWHGSSDFIGFSRCEALIVVPKGRNYEAGEVAEVLFL